MAESKKVPTGIALFIAFIITLDVFFFVYLGYSFIYLGEDFSVFLSASVTSVLMWVDVFLAVLSLLIIPYGFIKRIKAARTFALGVFIVSVMRVILYVVMTGEKIIGFLFFAFFVISMMYLLMTPVKRYFGLISMAIIPSETKREFTYGLYTLYTELVRLKNGKNQVIYFFSKRTPKSGTPTQLPEGFDVEVSSRSGLPYLKKKQENVICE